IQKLDPAVDLYRGFNAVTAHGAIDRMLFQRAVDEMLDTHEALRASFPIVGGRPVQRIHTRVEIPVLWRETDGLAADAGDVLVAEARRPYDFERGPLARFMVLACRGGDHVIQFAANHIIADLSTSLLLFEELENRYRRLRGHAARRMPLPGLS